MIDRDKMIQTGRISCKIKDFAGLTIQTGKIHQKHSHFAGLTAQTGKISFTKN